jgi:hypothetical protein
MLDNPWWSWYWLYHYSWASTIRSDNGFRLTVVVIVDDEVRLASPPLLLLLLLFDDSNVDVDLIAILPLLATPLIVDDNDVMLDDDPDDGDRSRLRLLVLDDRWTARW